PNGLHTILVHRCQGGERKPRLAASKSGKRHRTPDRRNILRCVVFGAQALEVVCHCANPVRLRIVTVFESIPHSDGQTRKGVADAGRESLCPTDSEERSPELCRATN